MLGSEENYEPPRDGLSIQIKIVLKNTKIIPTIIFVHRWSIPTLALMVALTAFSPLLAHSANVDASLSTAVESGPVARRLPQLGVMADAGLPDGANASLVFRPLRWLRVHGGGGYNMVSAGVRGGATVVPFGMGPSATLEAGHYFDGNANGAVQR